MLYGRGEHCSPAKNHKATFLIMFFSLVRKERKGQKEESIPLLNSFCRLAATSANKMPRPSRYSLSHSYRFETLKRRLGFTAVPCQATANLAVDIWVLIWGSLCADGIKHIFFAFSVCWLNIKTTHYHKNQRRNICTAYSARL